MRYVLAIEKRSVIVCTWRTCRVRQPYLCPFPTVVSNVKNSLIVAEHLLLMLPQYTAIFAEIWYNQNVVWGTASHRRYVISGPRFRSAIRHLGSNYLTTTVRYIPLLEALTSVYPARSTFFHSSIANCRRSEHSKKGKYHP